MDFAPYRAQITAIDLAHYVLIFALALVQFWLAVKTHETKDQWYTLWIPAFTIAMFGLVARNDTMVKRLGGWLASMDDLWEQALKGHAPTKYLMPGCDAFVFIPVLCVFTYAEFQAAEYWKTNNHGTAQVLYLCGTIIGLLASIGWWVLAATKAKTGF